MKNLYTVIGSALLVLFTTSCRKYVEIDQVGKRLLKYTDDYQNLLNNRTNVEKSFYYPVLASDDIYSADEVYLNRWSEPFANSYTWHEHIVGDNEDNDWGTLYKQIYLFNQIINEVLDSQGNSESQKQNILAQAKVHRALNYFFLINIYAKQYNPATASEDPGVPMLITPDLYADLTRVSVEGVYQQIIDDLQSALPHLPPVANFNSRASQAAAKGLLARVYLQMGNYTEALQYATETLAIQDELQDLNAYLAEPTSYPQPLFDDEEIFLKSINMGAAVLSINPEVIQLFGPGDLREELFIVDGSVFGSWSGFEGMGYFKHRLSIGGNITNGPSVPEMMLIQAEALARDPQRYTEATAVLNKLRKTRFRAEDYKDLQLNTPEEVLTQTLAERRKELLAKGLRWFDQKRLMDDSRFVQPVVRTYKGETHTLNPHSNRYVFPIAATYIEFNPEITQNPR